MLLNEDDPPLTPQQSISSTHNAVSLKHMLSIVMETYGKDS